MIDLEYYSANYIFGIAGEGRFGKHQKTAIHHLTF